MSAWRNWQGWPALVAFVAALALPLAVMPGGDVVYLVAARRWRHPAAPARRLRPHRRHAGGRRRCRQLRPPRRRPSRRRPGAVEAARRRRRRQRRRDRCLRRSPLAVPGAARSGARILGAGDHRVDAGLGTRLAPRPRQAAQPRRRAADAYPRAASFRAVAAVHLGSGGARPRRAVRPPAAAVGDRRPACRGDADPCRRLPPDLPQGGARRLRHRLRSPASSSPSSPTASASCGAACCRSAISSRRCRSSASRRSW